QVARETLALRAYEQRVSNIVVIDALAAGLPQVFADGYQIQQVLLNLVINAEQAMLSANGRGTLVVRTWHDAEQESVLLEINDDGPGIPEEDRKSTRLNSSHVSISYAVFCLKKKKIINKTGSHYTRICIHNH